MSITTTNTINMETLLLKEVIAQLKQAKVFSGWANKKYEGELKQQGDTVKVQEVPKLRGQRGGAAGADITAQAFALKDHSLQVNEIIRDKRAIGSLEKIRSNLALQEQIGSSLGEAITLAHENHIAIEAAKGVYSGNKIAEGAPVALATGTVHAAVEAMGVKREAQGVRTPGALFADATTMSLLRQSTLFDGFKEGLDARTKGFIVSENGLVGRLSNFLLFQTEEIPFKQKLTLDTNPTADDTVVLALYDEEAESTTTITLTWKAAPSAAGEIDIGSDAAASQANLVACINGTGTPGASTYIELSTANRAMVREYELYMPAFASDISYVYANRAVTLSETFTAATNIFGTAGKVMIGLDGLAINFVEQMAEFCISGPREVGAARSEIFYENVFQAGVLGKNNRRIVTSEIQYS